MSIVIYGDEPTFKDEEGDSLEVKKIKKLIREQEEKLDREIREVFNKTKSKNYEDIGYIDKEGSFHITEYGADYLNKSIESISKMREGFRNEESIFR